MSKLYSIIIFGLIGLLGYSQDPSAAFQVDSNDKGFLMPRVVDPENDVTSPATGLQVYNTTTNTINYFNGTDWLSVNGDPIGGYFVGQDVGDGIVFFVQTDTNGNQTGLIVSKEESPTNLAWQATASITNATSTVNGETNSTSITNSPAIDYVNGISTTENWYMPAVEELLLLFQNRYAVNNAISNSSGTLINLNTFYWSSTEANEASAFRVNSSTGDVFNNSKVSFTLKVRAIRAF